MGALRFPLAVGWGLLFSLGLFSVLWSFVNVTVDIKPVVGRIVDFTRQIKDTPVDTKRNPKPQREAPPLTPDLPRISGERFTVDNPTPYAPPVMTTLDGDHGRTMGVDGDPIQIVSVPPEYPLSAITKGIEGWVQVQFSITAAGTVRDPIVVASDPKSVFDAAALKAIARWRYNPRVVNGMPVERVGMQTVIRFNLEE